MGCVPSGVTSPCLRERRRCVCLVGLERWRRLDATAVVKVFRRLGFSIPAQVAAGLLRRWLNLTASVEEASNWLGHLVSTMSRQSVGSSAGVHRSGTNFKL